MSIIKKGQKFNHLTAISFSHKKGTAQHWLFECSCGIKKVICVSSVKREITKSCGCLYKNAKTTHGMSKTKVYNSWISMKSRCLNPKATEYKHYGGRGITVCDEWLGKNGFENFYRDMGDRPKNKSLDRIKNNLSYCKSNCRYATRKEQNNNSRNNIFLTYKNKTQTIAQWARELGINHNTFRHRIDNGWSIERAVKV